ncbi:FliH/SctL family protein [Novosphingobium sp.]|uniref:FliH/SctL family protein n=1 Tax=Novosphingobium sp. TaxID=1874826 RepID=UPI0026165670|nr:FliH/SctL family protein [Novosphingobium sp.]
MSEAAPGTMVRALSLAELGGGSTGFLRRNKWGQSPIFAEPSEPPPPEPEEDPETRAFAAGYAQGAADAEAAFTEALAAQDAARAKLEIAFGRLDADLTRELESRLRDTVLALCAPLLGEYAADADALAARVTVAAGMLARAADERVIRLHPEDLALLAARLPEDWHFEPDPALERGALRIEGSAGGVEDGPGTWQRALSDALSSC